MPQRARSIGEGGTITPLPGVEPPSSAATRPFYDDGAVRIYHGDCRTVLVQIHEPIDLVLTDFPYSEACHKGTRTGEHGDKVLVDFTPISMVELQSYLELISRVAKRWVIATMDYHHIVGLEGLELTELEFVRFGIWVKPNMQPQFSGDRPGTGWEGIAFLHRRGVQKKWNGGGGPAVYTYPIAHGLHPTQKPLGLMKTLVGLFSGPKDLVLDPFMGSGTTLRAAKDLGRRAIGIEIEERYCEIAAGRMAQGVLL